MKTSDLSTEEFFAAVRKARTHGNPDHKFSISWEVVELLSDYPWKIVYAKAKKLIIKGSMEGCWCGCSGIWIIKGEENEN